MIELGTMKKNTGMKVEKDKFNGQREYDKKKKGSQQDRERENKWIGKMTKQTN